MDNKNCEKFVLTAPTVEETLELAREHGASEPGSLPSDWDSGDIIFSPEKLQLFATACIERGRLAREAEFSLDGPACLQPFVTDEMAMAGYNAMRNPATNLPAPWIVLGTAFNVFAVMLAGSTSELKSTPAAIQNQPATP